MDESSTTRARRPRSITVGLSFFAIGSLLFAVLAAIVGSNGTNAFDNDVLLFIHANANHALDSIFVVFTELGGVNVITFVALTLTITFLIKKKYSYAALIAFGIGGVAAMNLFLKSIFERARPDLWQWIVTETHTSFPSGHATASMALALCIILIMWHTKWRVLTIAMAAVYIVLIGFSRLYLGVHFPTDILGGWLLGLAWIGLVIATIAIISSHRKPVGQLS